MHDYTSMLAHGAFGSYKQCRQAANGIYHVFMLSNLLLKDVVRLTERPTRRIRWVHLSTEAFEGDS